MVSRLVRKKIFDSKINFSPEIKNALDKRTTLTTNINQMGLIYDVNKSLPVPSYKSERLKKKKVDNGFVEEDQSASEGEATKYLKQGVVDELEKAAKALRESRFRLPKGVVKFVAYLIDKYGLDYKNMAKDPKNYDQETWRQLRAKCRKFMSIPDHFSKFLEERDLVDCDIDPEDPKWKESNTDFEDD